MIYKCGGIDKRTIEKFEKVRLLFPFVFRGGPERIAPKPGGQNFGLSVRGNLDGGVVRTFTH